MSLDSTISALPSATALTGGEVLPLNQGGVTSQATLVQVKTFVNSGGSAGTGSFTTVTASTSVVTPLIDTGTTGSLSLKTNNGTTQFGITHVATAVNNWTAEGNTAGNPPTLRVAGSDTNPGGNIATKGTGTLSLLTGGGVQLGILDTPSSTRNITVTGSNGGNPVIDVTAGALKLSSGTADIQWGKANVALGGGAAPTVGTIGGSGPAAAGQRNWLRFIESDGTASFIPVWR